MSHAQGTPEPWSFRDAFRHGTAAGGCWQHGELWQACPPAPCLELGHSFPWCPWHQLPQRGGACNESSIDGLFQCAPNCGHVDNCIGHIGESCRIRRAAVRRDGRDAAMDSVGGSRRVHHPSRPTWAHLLPTLNWMKKSTQCGSWVRPRWAAGELIRIDTNWR